MSQATMLDTDDLLPAQSDNTSGIAQYLEAFLRRRKTFLLALTVLAATVVALALLLPAYYTSTATVLIEQQEIPNDMVRTTISSYADQRLQTIQQRVMTRDNLLKLVTKYDLYPTDRADMATEELLRLVSRRITMDVVSGEFIDPRRGVPVEATIAFELGFTDRSPDKAFRVANELYSLYHEENLKSRQELVRETSAFLEAESEKLDVRVKELETQVARFKEAHVGELPELLDVNWQLYERTDSELAEITRSRRRLEDQVVYLESQLSTVSPYSGVVGEGGRRILSPSDRLTALQSELAQMQATYSEDHPDVQRVKSDIAGLRQEVTSRNEVRTLHEDLEALRSQHVAIRERYSDEHPDVVLLSSQINALLATLDDSVEDTSVEVDATNPLYVQLDSRLRTTQLELISLQQRELEVKQKQAELEARISRTPEVERTFSELAREYRNTAAKFAEVKAKQLEAELAESLEQGRKGEKFTLIDPPQIAEEPTSPNRTLILIVGLAFSLMASFALVALLESVDDRIYGPRAVAAYLGATPLALIPVMISDAEKSRGRWVQGAWFLSLLGLVAAALALIHVFFMPLDALFHLALARLGF